MPAEYQAITPEFLLIVFGLAILVLDRLLNKREKYLNALTALVGLSFAAIELVKLWTVLRTGGVCEAFSHGFTLDAFALYFKFIIVVATALVVLMSPKYLEVEQAHSATYYALLLLCADAMMILVSGSDLIVVFLALELMAFCEYLLAGFLRADRRSNEAALKFFLLGALASALLAYGMSLLYGIAGSTNFEVIRRQLGERSSGDPIVWAAMATLVAGISFKIAIVPFHQWVPDVFEGAPTSVTAFLSAAPLAACFAVLLRIMFLTSGPSLGQWKSLMVWIAAATLVLSNLAALTQTNIKRFLGYSTIAHVGYLLLGLAAALTGSAAAASRGQQDGMAAILIYLAVYTLMSLGCFGVILVMRRKHTIGDEIDDMAGLMTRSPGYAVLMLIFLLSLSGIPPTAGFIGKASVLFALIETGHTKMAFIGTFFGIITAYYYLRIVAVMFMKQSPDGVPLSGSLGVSVALGIAVVLTLAIGVYPQPVIGIAETAVRSLL